MYWKLVLTENTVGSNLWAAMFFSRHPCNKNEINLTFCISSTIRSHCRLFSYFIFCNFFQMTCLCRFLWTKYFYFYKYFCSTNTVYLYISAISSKTNTVCQKIFAANKVCFHGLKGSANFNEKIAADRIVYLFYL